MHSSLSGMHRTSRHSPIYIYIYIQTSKPHSHLEATYYSTLPVLWPHRLRLFSSLKRTVIYGVVDTWASYFTVHLSIWCNGSAPDEPGDYYTKDFSLKSLILWNFVNVITQMLWDISPQTCAHALATVFLGHVQNIVILFFYRLTQSLKILVNIFEILYEKAQARQIDKIHPSTYKQRKCISLTLISWIYLMKTMIPNKDLVRLESLS